MLVTRGFSCTEDQIQLSHSCMDDIQRQTALNLLVLASGMQASGKEVHFLRFLVAQFHCRSVLSTVLEV